MPNQHGPLDAELVQQFRQRVRASSCMYDTSRGDASGVELP
jgi:hypothetical protein